MFIPSIGREGPVLLIYDGHASHIGIQVIKLVIKNNINLLRSPSHHPSSTAPVKKFFLKRLKVHGPSGGDLKDILFLCDICQGVCLLKC